MKSKNQVKTQLFFLKTAAFYFCIFRGFMKMNSCAESDTSTSSSSDNITEIDSDITSTETGDVCVIWNNKGGSGKTTIAHCMALMHAIQNPDVNVLAIDMSPQADMSAAFIDRYVQTQRTLSNFPKTIRGYLEAANVAIDQTAIDINEFIIRAKDYNPLLPSNLYLLIGDDLNAGSNYFYYTRLGKAMPPNYQDPWLKVTGSLKLLTERLPNGWCVFIDTCPTFTIYTEMAIMAANKMIIPMRGYDDFSINGLENILKLVYGYKTQDKCDEDSQCSAFEFFANAKKHKLQLPKIDVIVDVDDDIIGTDDALDVFFEFYNKHASAFETNNIEMTRGEFEKRFWRTGDYFLLNKCLESFLPECLT